jgi:3D (Asp-Asp-Asp) domain-containing protein
MKDMQNNRGRRLLRWRIASIGVLLVGLSCIIVLLVSPYSPLHAASTPAAWSGNSVSYKIGDVVSYDGNIYQCIQTHTSESNWDPADTAALWTQQAGNISPTPTPIIKPTPTPAPILKPTPTSIIEPTPTPAPIIEPTPTSIIEPTPAPILEPTPTPGGTTSGGLTPVSVTFYSDKGLMADGQETHLGACAVWIKQYPFGTMFKLYDASNLNQAVYSCTAEDTGTHICANDIDVSLPGQDTLAIQLGVKSMQLQVVGFDTVVAQEALDNHPSSQGCELGATH